MSLKPLAGLRTLAIESYGAGPYGSMFLAQFGADVIKIEPRSGGDTSRATGPYFLEGDDSLFFQTFNLNKRSLTLDMKSPRGRGIFHALVKTSQALTSNMRGDQPEKLGITYAHLSKFNPAIVCAHISAYGRTTTRAAWPGYDYLFQAEAGFMSVTGEPDAPPARFGLSMVDFMTGSMLAMGTSMALIGALRTGQGCDIDCSLLDTALHQTSYPATWYLNAGFAPERVAQSAHPTVVPSQMFRTADSRIFIMAQLPKFYELFMQVLDRPDLLSDSRFATIAARYDNRDALIAEIENALVQRSTAHWLKVLGGKIPCAPVQTIPQALDSDFVMQAQMLTDVTTSANEKVRVLANPIRINGERLEARAAPKLGADSDDILHEIGLSDDDIATLRRDLII
jgi:crotonobetainyl-CoA:carnitine CoA-transferase CaiB-like acyl-CoA transferase